MSILSHPDVVVEGAFFLDDYGNRLWQNITEYVELGESAMTISQRRSTLFDERSPGTLSFVLNNDAGYFKDNNDSSPFYPGVTYDTPIRVRVKNATGTVNLLDSDITYTDDINFWMAEEGDLDTSTTSPPSGVTEFITWDTGVLDQTDVHVAVDNGPWEMPGDKPIYVIPGEKYSAQITLKATASIDVSLRMAWYDSDGAAIQEDESSPLTLTTSWQSLSKENVTAPSGACTLRIGIANETKIYPTSRLPQYRGGVDYTKQWVKELRMTVPSTVRAGDLLIAFVHIHNESAIIVTPETWTQLAAITTGRGKTYVHYRIAGPGTANHSWKWLCQAGYTYNERFYGALCAYYDVDQSSPFHQSDNQAFTGAYTVNHTTPGITTTLDNCLIVQAIFDTSTTTSAWSPPGGVTTRQYGYCVKGDAATGIIADYDGGTAGSEGNLTFTSNKASKYGSKHSLALTPASGTGPGTITVSIAKPIIVNDTSLPTWEHGDHWKDLITAYADEWNPYWNLNHALVGISATDRSKLLEGMPVQSALYESITDLDPLAYYLLDEGSDAVEACDISNNSQPAMSIWTIGTGKDPDGNETSISFGSGTGPGVDGTSAVMLNPDDSDNGQSLCVENLDISFGDCAGITGLLWFNSTCNWNEEVTLMKACPKAKGSYTRTQLEFYMQPVSPYIGVKCRIYSDSHDLDLSCTKSTDYFDGKTHMIAATAEIVGGALYLKLYVDGVLQDNDSVACSPSVIPAMNTLNVGSAYRSTRLTPGTFSHAALFNEALSAEEIGELYTAGNTAYANESVYQRIFRILDWEDQSGTDIDDSAILVDRHMADETSLLETLRLVAATDGGTLYVDGSDHIAFRSAATKEQEAVPALTLSAGDLQSMPDGTKNDALLVNDITVKRVGAGTEQRLVDTDSMSKYQRHEKTIETLLTTDQAAREVAGYYRAFYAEPYVRFDTVELNALLLSDWSDLLEADMWQILRITDLPSTAPSTTLDSHIEGWEWSIGPDGWIVTFDVSYAIPFAILGDSVRGICGSVVVAR